MASRVLRVSAPVDARSLATVKLVYVSFLVVVVFVAAVAVCVGVVFAVCVVFVFVFLHLKPAVPTKRRENKRTLPKFLTT
jgi:Flp pilus assembly protein TadB